MIDSKRRLFALALVGGAVALASGCGSSSSNGSSSGGGGSSSGGSGSHMGGTMKLQATGNPDSLDPAIAYEVESWQNLIMTNDGLTGFKRVGGPDVGPSGGKSGWNRLGVPNRVLKTLRLNMHDRIAARNV